MGLTIGLDLGDRWSRHCTLYGAGSVVLEQKVSGNVFLEVQDNGQGIDERHLSAPKSLGVMGISGASSTTRGDFTVAG